MTDHTMVRPSAVSAFPASWSAEREDSETQRMYRLISGSMSPDSKHGIGGRMLRMTTLPFEPFIIRHRNDTSTWYTGLCMDLLYILADTLNFTYTITEPPNEIWGDQLPNGTWAGMIGMLHRKEADFALSGMSVTYDRATLADYTIPFFYDEAVMITTLPDPERNSSKFYLQPFHWLVYVLLGCCFVMVTGVWVWLQRHYRPDCRSYLSTENKNSGRSIGSDIVNTVETLFGSLLGRGVIHTDVSMASNILLCAWLWLSVVMVATYTGKLTSSSVRNRQELPFNTLSELVKRTDYRWSLTKGENLDTIFSTSTNKVYQQCYRKFLEFAADDPDIRSTDINNKILPKVLNGQFVFMGSISYYKRFKSDHCELTVADERLFADTFGIYLQKGSPYTSMFNNVLARAKESGLLDFLIRKWFPEKSGCQGDQTTATPLSLELVQTPFVLAAYGLLLSAVLVLLECLVKHKNRSFPPRV